VKPAERRIRNVQFSRQSWVRSVFTCQQHAARLGGESNWACWKTGHATCESRHRNFAQHYLSQQGRAGSLFFRQRVTIPNVDPAAYQ